jgi:membrane protease YdiL (CAAX protease family)
MDEISPGTKRKWLDTVFNLFLLLMILVFPHLGLMPNLTYSIPIILLLLGYLKFSGSSWSAWGLKRSGFGWKPVLIGILSAVIIVLFMQGLFFPVLERFVVFEEGDTAVYHLAQQGPWELAFLITLSWIVGGFYEELAFHGFIFTFLERRIGGKHAELWSFVVTSLIFGAYHFHLGTAGTINALLVGMAYLGLFLHFKRNLWYSIVCHGTYNTLIFIMIYNGYFSS